MYAVIKTGGKQHKVQTGDVIEVEKIVHEGETMTFQPLLVVDDDGKTHVGAEAAKKTDPKPEKKPEKMSAPKAEKAEAKADEPAAQEPNGEAAGDEAAG